MKILWASRHPLDPAAEKSLRDKFPACEVTSREVLWPAGSQESFSLAEKLAREFDILAGVWPGQAVEAFGPLWGQSRILAPVSIPETEPETKKVRPFRFVRWAVLF